MPLTEIEILLTELKAGKRLALARAITIVENNLQGSERLLASLKEIDTPKLVGITGPPGAGKSTLVNALLTVWTSAGLNVCVLAVDPSSPFHFGSLLGDRIRMSQFYNHPQVFIRSLASRGALGGLHPRIFEITDVVKEAGFDLIILETVGVGQSEVEIAGIADCTVVTLVPEAGDMIQTMKAGLLEIADLFVVNKSDRADAETLYRNLRTMTHEKGQNGFETPVLKTIGNSGEGIEALATTILKILKRQKGLSEKQQYLQLQKLWHLVQELRMEDITKPLLIKALIDYSGNKSINIYQLAKQISEQKLP